MSDHPPPLPANLRPASRGVGSVGRGIGLGVLVTIGGLIGGGMALAIYIGAIILLGFAVVQFAWIIPMYRNFKRTGETETAKGLLIVAGAVVLLQGGCYAALLSSFTGK